MTRNSGQQWKYTWQVTMDHSREHCTELSGEGLRSRADIRRGIRVNSLNGLMLEESLDLCRFKGIEGNTERMRVADTKKRRPQHL